MTLFDYLVLFVVVCSIIISLLRGLVRETLSLLGWISAFFLANTYCGDLSVLLPDSLPGHSTRLIVAFSVVFIIVKLLVMLLMKTLVAVVQASGLTAVDRGLGSVFGLAKGALIVLIAVLICGMTALPEQTFWKQALLSPLAETAARAALPYLPGAMARRVKF
jgi:membrane protein required for colicin V production